MHASSAAAAHCLLLPLESAVWLSICLAGAGGVREAYKGKGEDYQLFWPEKSGAHPPQADRSIIAAITGSGRFWQRQAETGGE
jgi:hypothetical protein